MNPFHRGAGAGCFTWAKDREIFLNGPFQFRLSPKPSTHDDLSHVSTTTKSIYKNYLNLNSDNPRRLINPKWAKYIDATCIPKEIRRVRYSLDTSAEVKTRWQGLVVLVIALFVAVFMKSYTSFGVSFLKHFDLSKYNKIRHDI